MSSEIKKKIKSVANFRDLGGIVGADGKRIKPGLLFRSGHHAKLTQKDAQRLSDQFGIRVVADLRSDSELAERPDTRVSGIEYHVCSPLSDEENPSVNKNNRRSLLRRIMEYNGGARKYLENSYKLMVTSSRALEAYRKLLRLIIDHPDGGVLWHCTQGKDRAGIGTAAVLMALGVSREDIMKDYMLSNRFYRIKNKLIYAGVCVAAHSVRAASSLNSLLSARAEYLHAAFDELDKSFGGTYGFLRDGLNLSNGDLQTLRNRYLA